MPQEKGKEHREKKNGETQNDQEEAKNKAEKRKRLIIFKTIHYAFYLIKTINIYAY
jgi:hypothetical protein